jgi:muramoyltetrapeptide carboxypeptidase LdcA involved in peptidoglycan recycling
MPHGLFHGHRRGPNDLLATCENDAVRAITSTTGGDDSIHILRHVDLA